MLLLLLRVPSQLGRVEKVIYQVIIVGFLVLLAFSQRNQLQEEGLFNTGAGRDFRTHVLERGGTSG